MVTVTPLAIILIVSCLHTYSEYGTLNVSHIYGSNSIKFIRAQFSFFPFEFDEIHAGG